MDLKGMMKRFYFYKSYTIFVQHAQGLGWWQEILV
jgi:hypothetical protein